MNKLGVLWRWSGDMLEETLGHNYTQSCLPPLSGYYTWETDSLSSPLFIDTHASLLPDCVPLETEL